MANAIPKLRLLMPDGSDAAGARVLLHACCAPCSSAIAECMMDNGLRPLVYFCNPNIFPRDEYVKRKDELKRFLDSLGIRHVDDDACSWTCQHDGWRQAVSGLESEPERGRRCLRCFEYRLLRSAERAKAEGCRWLTTTLASSRWKSLEQINQAGCWAAAQVDGVDFWTQNWRRGGLQERRNQLLHERGFYNQRYCGCEFSLEWLERRDRLQSLGTGV